MSTPTRTLVVQVLEPSDDTLVGTGGSRDQSLEENGNVALNQTDDEITINFTTQKFSSDYDVFVYFSNTVDTNPTVIEWLVISQSPNALIVGISPLPDSNNYVLFWRVRVRDTATLTINQIDAPEGAVTPLGIGATSQIIQFVNPRSTDSYGFAEWVVQNQIDGDGQQTEWVQLIGRTTTSFTISINPPPDTANYNLRWRIAT
jgi:hypothetical protein